MTSQNGHVVMETNNLRENMPLLKPPDQNISTQIRGKGKRVIQLILITLMIIPAMLLALYKKLYPEQGKSLQNKIVLITGAGRGLGRGLAIKFAKEGCKVVCVDINSVSVAETAQMINKEGYKAIPYVTNIAFPEEVAKLAESVTKDLGPVDVLVNNAGLVLSHGILDAEDEHISGTIDVNFLSHFWMIRKFLPSMKERNSGHIVAISSMSAVAPLGNAITYTSCKFAVTGLMESLSKELRASPTNGIHITTVFPYFINTSEDYTKRWNIPLPELSIDEVVEKTVKGIKLNHKTIAVPEHLYYLSLFTRLLPNVIQEMISDVFKITFTAPDSSEWHKFPVASIIIDTLKK